MKRASVTLELRDLRMQQNEWKDTPGNIVRQERSRKTYEAFIRAGFRVLERDEFESITIAGLAKEAGYSVGAFYARFRSKDEFFEAMVAQHLRERRLAHERLFRTAAPDALIRTWIDGLVRYYWRRRRFWRAALLRSANDPDFWTPINRNAGKFVSALIARVAKDAGRELTKTETDNLRFAIHMTLSTVNNRIVNRPQPSLIGRTTFVDNLVRAFRLISDYDALS